MVSNHGENLHGEALLQKIVYALCGVEVFLFVGFPHIMGRYVSGQVDVGKALKRTIVKTIYKTKVKRITKLWLKYNYCV